MSWVPRDLSQTCAVYTSVTTCGPSSLLFLKLVATLFGWSRDESSRPGYGQNLNDVNGLGGYPEGRGYQQDDYRRRRHEEEYDFIIVGAGSAGCVVANRLSEISDWNILLIEGGGEEPEVAEVPAFAPLLMRSSIDYGYMTQPQEGSCRARPDGRCLWSRGRVMGGSSVLNYMIYIRGHPLDYDEWASFGNPGWAYKDVLPYFRKSEDNRNPERVDGRYHGQGGYQTVELFPYQDHNVLLMLEGYKELGMRELDQNAEDLIGTMLLQHTTRDGERLSTNGAFIRPIRNKRPNLKIMTNTRVVRTLIDPKQKTAFGVEVFVNGNYQQIYARKEVIISAGAIDSPKILMLSGVGLREDLQKYGIEVIKSLPVGYNLQDHTTIDGVVYSFNNESSTDVSDEQRKADVQHWQQKRRGPLAATGSLQVGAFVQTKYAEPNSRPDIQYSIDAVGVSNFFSDPILTALTNINPLAYYDGVMIRPILLGPKSRGFVTLNDSDPIFGDPLIYANTFTDKLDLATMVEGIKQNLNLLRTNAFRQLGARLVDTPLPACADIEFGTDEYWACISQCYTTTLFHPVGTCKMGLRNDREAVVDAKLRVHGIRNLRVIDASIMPTIIRGNTNAPTIMIGEKGSDMVKERWLKQGGSFEGSRSYHVKESEQF